MLSNRNLHKLLRVIFPEVLMEYFEISGWHDDSVKIEVWLDEKNYMEHSDYKSGTVISHGFTDEKVILDFPLRSKPVYLHVRRRHWYDKYIPIPMMILRPKGRNSLLSSLLF